METDYMLEDDNQILLEYRSKAIVKKLRDIVTQRKIDLYKLFRYVDVSKDGLVDQDEFFDLIKKIDCKLTKKRSNYVFDCYDTDQSK